MKHSTEYAKVDYHSVPKLVGAVVQGAARREVPGQGPSKVSGPFSRGLFDTTPTSGTFQRKKIKFTHV